MRQGDGSDLLGPGDQRNSEIGVLYVDPKDSRQDILTAISVQDLQGRKQIAIVLPEQGQAFRQPFDFEFLRKARRGINTQLIFITPGGPGPAEFARQNRFAVYSSLDIFRTALLNEGIPAPDPRVKSQPGAMPRTSLWSFGRRRVVESEEPMPAVPPLVSSIPSTPRTPSSPAPLVMPQTPQSGMSDIPSTPNVPAQNAQSGLAGIPSTPRMPNQPPLTPASNIDALDTMETGPAGAQSGAIPNATQGKPGAQPNSGAAKGMASGLESDDDALYTPPTPIAQGSATSTGSSRRNTPGKLPAEKQAAANIIAFPGMPPSTPKAVAGKTPQGKRASGKIAQNNPAGAQTPPQSGSIPMPAPGGSSTATSASASGQPDQSGAIPGASKPASGQPGGTGKVATPPANGQTGAAPVPTQSGSSTGKGAALPAAAVGAAIVGSAVNAAPPAAPGSQGAQGGATGAVGKRGRTVAQSAGVGGPGGGQRPTGLTPLPPPYSRRQRRRRNRLIAALILLLVLLGGTLTWSILAQRGVLPGFPGISNLLPGNINATVTITPASQLKANSYAFTGVTSTPDATRREVSARQLSQSSGTQTATANATGSIQAKQASGPLKFFNTNGSSITIASTTIRGKSGVPISFNGPVNVPAFGTFVTTGFAVNAGAAGNIPSADISESCCWAGISVANTANFTGGQDAQPNSVITQSDIDHAAQPLIDSLKGSTQAALAKGVRSNERVAESTLQCNPTVNSSQQPGSTAKTATVQVSLACTEEVYDAVGVKSIATGLLQSEVTLSAPYALDGQIVVDVTSVTPLADNQLRIQAQAQGLWVYGFNDQLQQNIKQSLVKLSKADAQNVLQHDMGVAKAAISLSSGNTMPANASNITLVIQQLPGVQLTPTPGPGTPPVNTTAQPTNAPQGSPTPVNGLGGS